MYLLGVIVVVLLVVITYSGGPYLITSSAIATVSTLECTVVSSSIMWVVTIFCNSNSLIISSSLLCLLAVLLSVIIFMLALQVIFGRQEMLLFNLLVHWSWRDNLSYLRSGNNNNIEQWQLAAVRYCYVILAVNRSVLPFGESLLKFYSCKFPVVAIPLHFEFLTELLTLRVVIYLSS